MSLKYKVMFPEGEASSGGGSSPPDTTPPTPTSAPTEPVAPSHDSDDEFVARTTDYDAAPYTTEEDLAIFGPGGPAAKEGSTPPIEPPAPTPETATPPASEEPKAPAAATTSKAPEEAATAPAAAPKEPPAAPPVPSTPTEPTAVVETPTPQMTTEQMQAASKEWRDGLLAAAEKAYEPFIAEHAAELLTSPETVLPKLAARLFVDIYEQAFKGITQAMPQVVNAVQQQRISNDSAWNEVFKVVPELSVEGNSQETRKRMVTFQEQAYNFRRLDPGATKEVIIAKARAATMIHLGIGMPQATQAAPAATSATVVPFRPGGVSTTGAPPPTKSTNAFEQLAEEFLMDDR